MGNSPIPREEDPNSSQSEDWSSSECWDEDTRKRRYHKRAIREKDRQYTSNFPNITNQTFMNFREDGFLTDVTFQVDDKKFFAHKLVLSSRSEVFHAMFAGGLRESKANCVIEISDADAASFERFLDVMYTCKVSDVNDDPIQIFALAHKYNVRWLMAEMEDVLIASAVVDNFGQYWKLQKLYDLRRLRKALINLLRVSYFKLLGEHWEEYCKDFEVLTELVEMIGGSIVLLRGFPKLKQNYRKVSGELKYYCHNVDVVGKNSIPSYSLTKIDIELEYKLKLNQYAGSRKPLVLEGYLSPKAAYDYGSPIEFPSSGLPLVVYVSVNHKGKKILSKELYLSFEYCYNEVIKIFAISLNGMEPEDLMVQVGVSHACPEYRLFSNDQANKNYFDNKGQFKKFQKFSFADCCLHFASLSKCQEQWEAFVNPPKAMNDNSSRLGWYPSGSDINNAISRLIELKSLEQKTEEEESEEGRLLQFVKYHARDFTHSDSWGDLKNVPSVIGDVILTMLSDCFLPALDQKPITSYDIFQPQRKRRRISLHSDDSSDCDLGDFLGF